MSNGTAPIETAPVPPSIAGIPQPVFAGGSATNPPTPINITGSPIIPPPTIGDPEGFPVFPPVSPDTAPVPVPVGPLVGPAVPAAPVPPSVAGFPQPTFVPPGSGTVPTAASLFPAFTAAGPFQPIVMVTAAPPPPIPLPLPTTPGQNPPPVVISTAPNIPQLPWNPHPPEPELPPVNTVRPTITPIGTVNVGEILAGSTGTWTTTAPPLTYARQWMRDGSPIAGATGISYTCVAADLSTLIGLNVTATDANGVEASAEALEVGPVLPQLPTITAGQSFSATLPLVASQSVGVVATTGGAPSSFAITGGNASGYWQVNAAGDISATAAGVAGVVAGTTTLVITASNSGGTSPPANVNVVVAAAELDETDEETVNPQRSQEPQAKHRSHHAKPHKKR